MEEVERAQGRAATLVQVAELAGVSVSTAGRALRGTSNKVAPDLAARVREAAQQLGYVPNAAARSLRSGSTGVVGLVVGDMLDPYYAQIAETVTETAESQHGMVAIVSNMQRDPRLELRHCQQLWGHRVSGLILAGGGFDQWSYLDKFSQLMGEMQRSGVAVASLSPRGVDLPTFAIDHHALGILMADQLIEAGHKKVGILLGPYQSEATQQRLFGASRTLMKAGLGFSVRHVDYTPDAGAETVKSMLKSDPELTGFIAGANTLASGVLRGLGDLGMGVPSDASVISVGSPRTAAWSSPRLTTVDARLDECARAALNYIAAATTGGSDVPESLKLPPVLVPGESIGPRPGTVK